MALANVVVGFFVFITIINVVASGNSLHPNIVFIVADDMGWDDVSFHGSDQILTPNIDLLAYTGVALGRYYSHCVCTPSRAALLTGKYAYTTGMHGYPLTNGEDRALPLTEKLLPQYLKENGYATNLIGKWHVGRSRKEYLPTERGFDSHFGHRGGYLDYYEYTAEETWTVGKVSGMDLFRNFSVAWDAEGYITDLYNEEAKTVIKMHDESKPLFLMLAHNAPHGSNDGAILQAPPDIVRTMRHLESPERRIYAAMVKKLDDSIGDVIEALCDKGILDNTIIVFISDNGGMTSGRSQNYASNWPLRGLKFSPFEGGVRVVGLLWTSTMNPASHLWNGYIHIVDWLPTILGAAGIERPTDIDGINLWDDIISNRESKREEFFEVYDYIGFITITSGDYKLVTGNVSLAYSNYQGGDYRRFVGREPSYINAVKNSKVYSVLDKIGKSFQVEDTALRNELRVDCNNNVNEEDLCYPGNGTVCLFNIKADPCETQDLSGAYPDIVQRMLARLQVEKDRIIPRVPLFRDPRALPILHNYTWSTWADNIKDL